MKKMIKKLLNTKMKFAKNQKGLTLIELLVVIVILGIIAAIAIPMVMGNKDDAALSTNKQNLQIIQDAVNRYHISNTTWPTTASLEADLQGGAGGPYLDELPKIKQVNGCNGTGWTVGTNGKISINADAPAKCLPAS